MMKVRLNRRNVQVALLRRNMSQNMMASRTGLSSGYLSQLMCGTRYASPRARRKIMELLSPMTFDDLFTIEEDDEPAGG